MRRQRRNDTDSGDYSVACTGADLDARARAFTCPYAGTRASPSPSTRSCPHATSGTCQPDRDLERKCSAGVLPG